MDKDFELVNIPGFEDYQIDRYGNLYSKLFKKYMPIYIGTPQAGKHSYKLYTGACYRYITRSRLVAMAFLPLPTLDGEGNYRMYTALYRNGVEGDDHVDNLYWVKKNNPIEYKQPDYDIRENEPILIYYIDKGTTVEYKDSSDFVSKTGYPKEELFRRLSSTFGSIFQDKTMVKYASDPRPFRMDIVDSIKNSYVIKGYTYYLYNYITKKGMTIDNLDDACTIIKVSGNLGKAFIFARYMTYNGYTIIKIPRLCNLENIPMEYRSDLEIIKNFIHIKGKHSPVIAEDESGNKEVFPSIRSFTLKVNGSVATVFRRFEADGRTINYRGYRVTKLSELTDDELITHIKLSDLEKFVTATLRPSMPHT